MSNNIYTDLAFKQYNNFIFNFELFAEYIFYTLTLVKNKTISLPYYQHFINIIFIFLIIIILYILYRDITYRNADKSRRCIDIEDTIKINSKLSEPYNYNIFIINKNDTKDMLKKFCLCIKYDFVNEKSDVIFGARNYIEHMLYSSKNINDMYSKAFSVFNLNKLDVDLITYENTYYINKSVITSPEYLYIITTSDNNVILKDRYSVELSRFVKKYGYDNSTSLAPIYNILYAIDNQKNKNSI